jgi:hypothetical protein
MRNVQPAESQILFYCNLLQNYGNDERKSQHIVFYVFGVKLDV